MKEITLDKVHSMWVLDCAKRQVEYRHLGTKLIYRKIPSFGEYVDYIKSEGKYRVV